jgi:hypothetical protein
VLIAVLRKGICITTALHNVATRGINMEFKSVAREGVIPSKSVLDKFKEEQNEIIRKIKGETMKTKIKYIHWYFCEHLIDGVNYVLFNEIDDSEEYNFICAVEVPVIDVEQFNKCKIAELEAECEVIREKIKALEDA